MTMTQQLTCLGYGYTARALARILQKSGWKIAGSTRSGDKAAEMRRSGIAAFLWDGNQIPAKELTDATALLIAAAPTEAGCPVLGALPGNISEITPGLTWAGYLSTNGVYGDHAGDWVNEDSELRGSSPRARRRIEAEQAWREFGRANGLRVVIFRLPGIYGPGRSALDSVRAGEAKRIVKPGQVFSRIHVDDIATALAASISCDHQEMLFNVADDEPAPQPDVIEYACGLLGVEPPPLLSIEDADLSEMAKSFYADNKRVSSARMKQALGVELKYPNYRAGLKAILDGE